MQEYKYYVGGEFRNSGDKIEVVDPYREDVFAVINRTSKDDFDFALEKCRQAQKEWKKVSFKGRAEILREISRLILDNISLLAQLETKEIGKTNKESLFVDIPLAAEVFNYYASLLETLEAKVVDNNTGSGIITYQPYGVCGIYLPYNVPIMIFGFSCAAALGAGNGLIIKPSEYGSLSILELAKYLDKLDIPRGLINVVTGEGDIVGEYLASSDIELISFTGSRQTLEKIWKSASVYPKKMICELGGANIAVVFADAELDRAVDNILSACFIKQGQMCIGTSIILLEEDVFDIFINKFIEKLKNIKIGDPFDPLVGLGPLPCKEHLERVKEKVAYILDKKGGRLIWEGVIREEKGYFYPPQIIEISDIIYEEFFAPVVLVKKVKSEDIKDILNLNPTGLVLQIWTNDLNRAYDLAYEVEYGTVWINTFAQMGAPTVFGGVKKSGWGRNLGKHGLFEYLTTKYIGKDNGKGPAEGWFGV